MRTTGIKQYLMDIPEGGGTKTHKTAPGQQYSLVDTVGSSQHMFSVNERSAAHVHHGTFLPLENSRLPRVLAELSVALRELRVGVLDAAQEPLGVACAAGVLVGARGGAEDGAATTHVLEAAAAVLWGEACELALRGGREPLGKAMRKAFISCVGSRGEG